MTLTILGDSIAVGTGWQITEATTIAHEGDSAATILAKAPTSIEGDLVISAGSNNLRSSTGLETTLRAIRARGTGRVLWILPANAARASVVAVADEQGDRTVSFAAGPDGVHPRSYVTLARAVRAALAEDQPQPEKQAMRTSVEGLAEIAGHEGIVLSPYRDSVRVWTVFIGHTRSAGAPNPETMPKGVAQPLEDALAVFKHDIVKYEDGVNQALTRPVSQTQFDALVSFHYNTGRIKTATLTKKVNAGDFADAAAEFDKWHRPPEVTPRRDKEKRLFTSGVYSNGGRTTLFPADANGRVQWSQGHSVDILKLLRDMEPGGRQPDDPGPVPVPDAEEPQPATQPPPGGFSFGRTARAAAGLIVLAAVGYALRKPIGWLVHWIKDGLEHGSPARQIGIAIGLVVAAAAVAVPFAIWVF